MDPDAQLPMESSRRPAFAWFRSRRARSRRSSIAIPRRRERARRPVAGRPRGTHGRPVRLRLAEMREQPRHRGGSCVRSRWRRPAPGRRPTGFHGPPDNDGLVEIGYEVEPEHRRRGFASEATEGLVEWAFAQPGVKRVVAAIRADNEASLGVVRGLGFEPAGSRGTPSRAPPSCSSAGGSDRPNLPPPACEDPSRSGGPRMTEDAELCSPTSMPIGRMRKRAPSSAA